MPYTEKQLQRHTQAMERGDVIPVVLETHEKQRAEGRIRLLRLSPAERRARAVKFLLTCFVIAPFTVIAPPHGVWVLTLIAVGIIGYYLRRGRVEIVVGGEARCPKCDAFQILDPGNAEFPMAHFCSECRKRSLVSLATETASAG